MSDRVIIRAPNHLGDLVMALPALAAVPEADVLVARGLAPLLELVPGFGPAAVDPVATGGGGAPGERSPAAAATGGCASGAPRGVERGAAAGGAAAAARRVIPLDRGARGAVAAAAALRRVGYARGVLLTPSFSSALVFALGGVRERRGTATDGRSALLTDRVPVGALAGLHRAAAYVALATGRAPALPPVPRLTVPEALRTRWRAAAGVAGGPVIGIFPGGNASSRRWEPDRYAAVARRLAAGGARVVVFGGPAERALAAEVAGDVAVNMAGRTDLPLLAAGLEACDLLVTNDTGPLHLAAAVGTPTVSLWGAGDPAVTGPLGAGHVVLRRPDLPCAPCVKNVCRRRGRGYVLPEAERECLRLIEVADVVAAASQSAHVERETLDG
ncbi:MAG TPA: glycosyltransferase family 9 protein [Longimicrobiales bacterium]